MKNTLKITAIVAFMFISITATAHEPKLSLTAENQTKTLVFELDSKTNQSFIQLMDSENNTIFSENVSNTLYSKKFNLRNLKTGTYFLKVENELNNAIYTINLNSTKEKITIKKENQIKPVFRKVGTKTSVSLLNTSLENVDLKIIDNNGRLVFKESFVNQLVVEKIFNFESALIGKYSIILKRNNESYSENIDIQ